MYATYNSFRNKTSPSPQLWAGEPPRHPAIGQLEEISPQYYCPEVMSKCVSDDMHGHFGFGGKTTFWGQFLRQSSTQKLELPMQCRQHANIISRLHCAHIACSSLHSQKVPPLLARAWQPYTGLALRCKENLSRLGLLYFLLIPFLWFLTRALTWDFNFPASIMVYFSSEVFLWIWGVLYYLLLMTYFNVVNHLKEDRAP